MLREGQGAPAVPAMFYESQLMNVNEKYDGTRIGKSGLSPPI
jgi:hypothetical protein